MQNETGKTNLKKSTETQLQNIKMALQAAARIVDLYGDRYLPIFKRIHEEFEKLKSASDFKSLAIKISRGE